MNCQKCGHPQSSHIYLEGACRPGFACPCDHYVPPKDPRTSIVHENTRPLTPCPNSREIIPHKSMDPDVSEILMRLKRDLKIPATVNEGTFQADYRSIVEAFEEVKSDLDWATSEFVRDKDFLPHSVNWKIREIRKKWGL